MTWAVSVLGHRSGVATARLSLAREGVSGSSKGVLIATVMLLLLTSAHADQLLSEYTVDSMLERLIPRSQLQSYGPGDYPTSFRWYVPIRMSVLSKNESARTAIEHQVIGPLLAEFRGTTSFEATLVEYGSDTNVLLIVGDDPLDDLKFYANQINQTANDPEAYSKLAASSSPDSTPCYRKWRFIQGAVERAILYAPSPSQGEAFSAKCIALNFGVLVGLLGKPSSGDTITNIQNRDVLFTTGDKAALRVLYDELFEPHMTLESISTTVGQILSRPH